MRGRKLSYDPSGWDEPIWKVVFADAENVVVEAGLLAGDAMLLATMINSNARRKGLRWVEVKEMEW